MNKNRRQLFTLVLLCVACGSAIAIAYWLLSPRIAEQQRNATEAIYFDTLQLSRNSPLQLDSSQTLDDAQALGLRAPQPVYIARQENNIIGIVLPLTAREGYAGDIDLLVGLGTDGKIISVRVVSQHETRDLGDKIEPDKSRWLEQFRGMNFTEETKAQWRLRSEGGAFDGISGATVTSRAVIKAVQQALDYFETHRAELLETANSDSPHKADI